MIQRIQTIYLLLVVVLMTATLFLPLAVLTSADQLFGFDASGISTLTQEPELIYPTWGLFALTAIIALLAFVTIFLFKRRMLQIRLCVFNGVLMLGFYAMFFFFYWNLKNTLAADGLGFSLKFALCFPFVSMVLDYLAIRNIGADEILVRSADRVRG